MRQVAEKLGVSLDAVVYVLRKSNVPRRSSSETNSILYRRQKPSFTLRRNFTPHAHDINLIGAVLYWAEGHKTASEGGIDFANSDIDMVSLFVLFLRKRYRFDEKRLRAFLYCHKNQDVTALTQFWSKKLKIPETQFTRPYIRQDFRQNGRKMPWGLIHIRYSDKKLLLDILNLIDSTRKNGMRRW